MTSRILIVDDHELFRSRARALLEAEGLHVVGEAEDGGSAVAQTQLLHPDLVLLDVQLPGRDGFDVADDLGQEPQSPTVVLISSRHAEEYGARLAKVDVGGFINKSDLSRAAIEALLGPLG